VGTASAAAEAEGEANEDEEEGRAGQQVIGRGLWRGSSRSGRAFTEAVF